MSAADTAAGTTASSAANSTAGTTSSTTAGSASGSLAALWLLVRPRRGPATVTGVQIAAAALATLLSFAVASVALAFWRAPGADPGYRVLAVALAGLLVFPLVSLGSAAARLSARSREERLATLRLLGVTASRVRWSAVADSTVVAATGVLLGTGIGLLLPFALQALPARGARFAQADLTLPWWLSLLIPVALIAAAALSGVLGLRSVILSPLGVRSRANAPRLSWLRVVLALVVMGGGIALTRAVSPGWGLVAVVAALGLAFLASMGVLSLIGPAVLLRLARRRAGRASDPARLIALRGIADAPRAAWRGVSVLALATFVVLPVGSLLGYVDAIQRSESGALFTAEQGMLLTDARTMLVVLVAVVFLVATCQLAMTHVATVIERRELFLALHRIGMPVPAMQRSRRIGMLLPAVIAVGIAVVATALLCLPLIVAGTVLSPLFTVAVFAVLAAGLALVAVGISATSPALRQELARAGGAG